MITAYLLLFCAIFMTIMLVSYLLHLNDKNLPLPASNQILDIIVYFAFAGLWVAVVFVFKNPI